MRLHHVLLSILLWSSAMNICDLLAKESCKSCKQLSFLKILLML